jgi:hypothetical protein
MPITAEYVELKRKLDEVRANKANLQAGLKRPQRASVKADQEVLLASLEGLERNTLNEIELYELTFENAEARLQTQIELFRLLIDRWRGNSTKNILRSRQRALREKKELQAKLQKVQQRKVALQENINRFHQHEAPEWRKAIKRTKERLARVAEELQYTILAAELRDSSTLDPLATDAAKDRGENDLSLKHSPDYQDIQFHGLHYRATPQQASIIRVLDEARLRGEQQVSTQEIKKAASCGKISDSFRAGDGHALWNDLVKPVKGRKGMYTLHLAVPEK